LNNFLIINWIGFENSSGFFVFFGDFLMSAQFDPTVIHPWLDKLNNHPIYSSLNTLTDLRHFMMHHVYSVWDFMSLIKYLQNQIAPAKFPWKPIGHASVRRFINALVLEEESDESVPTIHGEIGYSSHFELYVQNLREIGADPEPVQRFVELASQQGINVALESEFIPEPSRHFTQATFEFIATDKPHVVAAALALGREHVIPGMFRALLEKMHITLAQAPTFHYYLNRHIHLDEDFHAPLSLQLLNELCAGDIAKIKEAEMAAQQAIQVRIRFWDEVFNLMVDGE
jgi:hypothetical protein